MDFALTEEQQLIQDTAATFLAEASSSEAVRNAMQQPHAYDVQLWKTICADLYWQAIHIPEEYSGLGLGCVELIVMQEQMGRYLLCAPFFSSVCLAANAILIAGDNHQKLEYLSQIAAGTTASLAFTGAEAGRKGGQWGAEAVQLTATKNADGYLLNGELRYVPDGASAEMLVVAARLEGSQGEAGVCLFVVPGDSDGVSRHVLATMDQTRAQASISFDNVAIPAGKMLGGEGVAWQALEKTLDIANIALAAEQLGGAQQCLDMAVAYAKERVQFNRPIAGFQAIKHMAADMMQRVEVARSGVYFAACVAQEALFEQGSSESLAEAASVAKSYASEAFFKNAGDALQMHGGVGFTWEYDVHLYFKRAKASEHFLGNSAWHRERLAKPLLD